MGQGQSLDSMTQNQSREELLHQLVLSGNAEAIKALCREGVNLEWIDKEGKTPLIIASMDSGLFSVAKALTEMGANVNSYRPGRHAGTPLHHAAKRGLVQTVNLLLCSGANPLMRNDDCQTALDVARIKGHTNVVRAIENHICFFSGWLREFYGPGFLEALAPQFLSRKVWVAVTPCGSNNPRKPLRLELAIYTTLQDAQPRTVIALWKANIEQPKFQQSDPGLTIFDLSTKTRFKFASVNEGDKQQLHCFYDACGGIPQVIPMPADNDVQAAVPVIGHQASAEAAELAVALTASIQSAAEDRLPNQGSEAINTNSWGNSVHGDGHNGWGSATGSVHSVATSSGWLKDAAKADYNGWGSSSCVTISNQDHVQTTNDTPTVQTSAGITASTSSAPSAPPIPDEALVEGLILYPSIDFSPVDLSVRTIEQAASMTSDATNGGASSSCIICWEAPVEGACIPCGHMAGCMPCLSEIKTKKGVCPVCRAQINQILRLYAV